MYALNLVILSIIFILYVAIICVNKRRLNKPKDDTELDSVSYESILQYTYLVCNDELKKIKSSDNYSDLEILKYDRYFVITAGFKQIPIVYVYYGDLYLGSDKDGKSVISYDSKLPNIFRYGHDSAQLEFIKNNLAWPAFICLDLLLPVTNMSLDVLVYIVQMKILEECEIAYRRWLNRRRELDTARYTYLKNEPIVGHDEPIYKECEKIKIVFDYILDSPQFNSELKNFGDITFNPELFDIKFDIMLDDLVKFKESQHFSNKAYLRAYILHALILYNDAPVLGIYVDSTQRYISTKYEALVDSLCDAFKVQCLKHHNANFIELKEWRDFDTKIDIRYWGAKQIISDSLIKQLSKICPCCQSKLNLMGANEYSDLKLVCTDRHHTGCKYERVIKNKEKEV